MENLAVIVLSAFAVTLQVPPEIVAVDESHPVQPTNILPVSGVAVSVTGVPASY